MSIINNTFPGGILFRTSTLVDENSYTILPTDYFIIVTGDTQTNIVLTSGMAIGQQFVVRNISNVPIKISGINILIDNDKYFDVYQNESYNLISDGAKYRREIRDINYTPIASINGLSGTNITLTPSIIGAQTSGNYLSYGTTTTSDIEEGINLYYTNERAKAVMSGTYPIAVSNGLVSIQQASSSNAGYLSSTDWTDFNNKQDVITGAITTVLNSNLSSNAVVITDANGKISGSSIISATELGYLDGVTSAIQTQLNGKQASGNYLVSGNNYSNSGLSFLNSKSGTNLVFNTLSTNGSITATLSNGIITLFGSDMNSVTSVNGKSGTVTLDSDDISEGSTNLYFTNSRALSATSGPVVSLSGTTQSLSLAIVSISGVNNTQNLSIVSLSGTSATHTNQITTANASIVALSGLNISTNTKIDTISGTLHSQIDLKQDIITGAATTVISSDLTASRVLVSDANGKISASSQINTTELGYLNGVSSDIQTQINAKLTSGSSTTGIPEGTNLYYTNARVYAALSGTTPITETNGTISITQANTSTNGYLSSTDWNTFNNKISSGTSSGTGYSVFNSKSNGNLIFNTISGNGTVKVTYLNGLINISGSSTVAVNSVNGMTGEVIITATGIGAQPSGEYVSKLGDTIYGSLIMASGVAIIPESNFNYIGNSGSYFNGVWTEKIIADNLNYQDMAFRNNYEPLLHYTNNQYRLKNISSYWSGVATQPYNYGCFDGEYFWIGSFYTKKLLKLNQSAIESVYTLDFPILCLTSDNSNIWVGCADDHAHLIQVDQKTGSVLNTYILNPSGIGGTNNGGIQGLAHDGKYLWVGISQFGDDKPINAGIVTKIDCENGNQLISYSGLSNVNGMLINDQITASGNTRFIWTACDYFVGRINTTTNEINKYGTDGLSYRICTDGDYIYTALYDSGLIKKILARTGEVVDVWQSGPLLNTIAFDGRYIWVAGDDDNVTVHDRNTGKILMKVPGNDGINNTGANSLVFDGTYMWTVGFGGGAGGNIRKMSISDKIGNVKFANSISIMDSNDDTGMIMSARRMALLPGVSGTYSIGSLNLPFSGIYANNIYQNGIKIFNTSGTTPISVSNGLVTISQSNTTTNGYLSSTDWNTFNNKQSSGNYLVSGVSTTGIPEGTNLYFTSARAVSAISGSYVQNKGTFAAPRISGSSNIYLNVSNITPISLSSSLITLATSSSTRTIYPTTNGGYDLGTTTSGWKSVYVSGTVFTSGLSVNSTILPYTNNTLNIGSTTLGIKDIYVSGNTYVNSGIFTTLKVGANPVLVSGSTSTSIITEGTNLYYTNDRARAIVSGTTPISVNNALVTITQANTSTNGYLSSTDWNTFNNKQSSIGYTPANKAGDTFVGDISAPVITATTAMATNSGITFSNSGTASIGSTSSPANNIYTKNLNGQIVAVNKFNEVPTGLINGVNKTYSLTYTPVTNSLQIIKNGIYMCPSGLYTGVGDYVISGNSFTMITAPFSGTTILCNYVYQI